MNNPREPSVRLSPPNLDTPHRPTKESMEQWKHLDEQKQVYDAVTTDGDNDVGKVLAALKETGVENNTIVLFSSDNGPEWTNEKKKISTGKTVGLTGYDTYYSVGETGGLRGRKRSLFEGGVRVPFMPDKPNPECISKSAARETQTK